MKHTIISLAAAFLISSVLASVTSAEPLKASGPVVAPPGGNLAERMIGHHDPKSGMDLTFVMKLNNKDQLDEFLEEVQDPHSSHYHRFLTPAEFARQYGPTQAQVDQVKAYLETRGLRVTRVNDDRVLVHATGKSGDIEQMLGIRINDYARGSRIYQRNDRKPQLDRAIADKVLTISGLNGSGRLISNAGNTHGALAASGDCGIGGDGGKTPAAIAAHYEWPSITTTATASGQAIGIVTFDSANISTSDFTTYWSTQGIPSHTTAKGNAVSHVYVDGQFSDSTNCDQQETELDVELSSAMAPGAAVYIYDADDNCAPSSCYENNQMQVFEDAYSQIFTDNKVSVVTTSFSFMLDNTGPTTDLPVDLQDALEYALFPELSAIGVSLVSAAGDCGDTESDYPVYDTNPLQFDQNGDAYPAASAFVTAVGGTTLTGGAEIVWNASDTALNPCGTSFFWATGGGSSSSVETDLNVPEPWWQSQVASIGDGYRHITDISMDADLNTGYNVFIQGAWQEFGGTSAGAPQIAALIAIAVQQGGSRLGQINPLLYAIGESSSYASDFHDVTSGNTYITTYATEVNDSTVTYSGPRTGHPAATGWDNPTGWGTPKATNLISDLISQNQTVLNQETIIDIIMTTL